MSSINLNADDLRKLGKNDERECARSHQKGRKHSPCGQCSWDEAGLEPQIAEGRTSKPGEHQADSIRSVMLSDRQPCQGLQLVRFECMQVVRTTQYPQNVKITERYDDQDRSLDQPPARGQQSQASIDWHEDHVKSHDQDDIEREDGEIAGDAQTKEPFVRHDVPRRLRGIVEGDELLSLIHISEPTRLGMISY